MQYKVFNSKIDLKLVKLEIFLIRTNGNVAGNI